MKDKYILVGKAASGKNFMQQKMISKGYIPMKQYTSRPIRENETGDEYHFVNNETFLKMKDEGKFVSANFYAIGWYGISLDELKKCDVAILSPANIKDIFEDNPELRNEFKIIYIDVPVEVRIERLKKRYVSKFDDDNERRIQADENDFKLLTDWDLTVKNENEIISFVNNLHPIF